jgi:hypothetical protein
MRDLDHCCRDRCELSPAEEKRCKIKTEITRVIIPSTYLGHQQAAKVLLTT